MTFIDPHATRSHRGGHWFDPNIAHQVSPYVEIAMGAIPVAKRSATHNAAAHGWQAWLGRR
jgi:hypothetical protein